MTKTKMLLLAGLLLSLTIKANSNKEEIAKIANQYFEVSVSIDAGKVNVRINDLKQNVIWADGTYRYELGEIISGQLAKSSGLELPKIESQTDRIRIRGVIGSFEIEHDLILTAGIPFLAEEMKIINTTGERRSLKHFHAAFTRRVTGTDGEILKEFVSDHFQGVPFLHRSCYQKTMDGIPDKNDMDFQMEQIIEGRGFVFQASEISWEPPRRLPSRSFISEGWGWRHGDAILGIFSFNQDNMIFSSLSYSMDGFLHFGGFTKEGLNLSTMERFEPFTTVYLGLNRLYSIAGDYNQIAYQYRDMLDEMGCRFPEDFNPPVHWNQLYSDQMAGAWDDRSRYSRNKILDEAVKAKEHSCQALYLDPGWDTDFGSFLWGTDRLGDCRDYIRMVEKDYGLKTSLHTPMPPWASNLPYLMGPSSVESWPASSRRMLRDTLDDYKGVLVPVKKGPQICMGSRQFQSAAEQRLLKLCEAGVSYLMFDGTWWNGPCEDKSHGHPVPYLIEDHIDACVNMARRIHRKYPDVLIEMHDMVNGGHWTRSIPVYYKYGLPGSYDENWGFELMWAPFRHLKDKTALAMYYYNLGCNVPLYLHVNTGMDNENSLILWWFASTTRHLGIGGDSPDPGIIENHHRDMKRYIELEDFYKRGDFYGINEEIHVHTRAKRQECVINIFNLSDSTGVTGGSVALEEIGLDPGKKYSTDQDWIKISKGRLTVSKEMKPWDADLGVVKPRQGIAMDPGKVRSTGKVLQ